ncbi:MAG: hypothetical protein JWN76_3212 [Chitinophagaceae bacterium]|nr:hypothetical protein [Chitinophagaceae bacterium]
MKTGTKEIWLTNESLLSDIQEEFNLGYPFLKIEFLKTDTEARNLRSIMIDPSTSLKQLANLRIVRKIDINNYRTVAEISHDFEIVLGIMAQVSRKSGNIWNLVSVTDGWTLETQNAAGEFISSEMTTRIGL